MKKVHLINYIDIDIIGYFEALCEIKNAKTLTYSTEQTDVTCKKCLKILEKKEKKGDL